MERIKCTTRLDRMSYYLHKIQIAAALNKQQLIISDCKWAVAWQSFWILSDIYTLLVVLWQSKYDPFANSSDIISYKWGDAQCFYGSQIYIYLWINGYQRLVLQKRTEKQYSSIPLLSGHWWYPKNISHWKRVEIVFLIICLCTIWFSVYSCY